MFPLFINIIMSLEVCLFMWLQVGFWEWGAECIPFSFLVLFLVGGVSQVELPRRLSHTLRRETPGHLFGCLGVYYWLTIWETMRILEGFMKGALGKLRLGSSWKGVINIVLALICQICYTSFIAAWEIEATISVDCLSLFIACSSWSRRI